MFLKMKCHLSLKRWCKGHSIFEIASSTPSPCLVFFRATWQVPTKFHGKKGNTNGSKSLHSVKLLAEGFMELDLQLALSGGTLIPVKPVAEGFTVHTYVWLHCL